MARSEKRRKKQLEKKKARRNEKRLAVNRQVSLGLAGQLQKYQSAPILECWITASSASGDCRSSSGMHSIHLSRKAQGGEVAFCSVLVDSYYMGVKDAMAGVYPLGRYREVIERSQERVGLRRIDPASARKLIEDAIEFAGKLGLRPCSDYRLASILFEDIDSSQAVEIFEMGMDGKPMYVSGPNSAKDMLRIHAARAAIGEENLPQMGVMFDVSGLSSLPSPGLDGFSDLDFDETDFDDETDEYDDDIPDDEIEFEDEPPRGSVRVIEPNRAD